MAAKAANRFTRWLLALLVIAALGWVIHEEIEGTATESPLSTYEAAGRAIRDGRFSEALRLYDQVLKAKPGLTPAIAGKALAYTQMGNNNKALATYDDLLLLEPRSAGTHANRGVVLERLGRLADALTAFETALTLDPTLNGRPNALLMADPADPLVTIDQRARRLRTQISGG